MAVCVSDGNFPFSALPVMIVSKLLLPKAVLEYSFLLLWWEEPPSCSRLSVTQRLLTRTLIAMRISAMRILHSGRLCLWVPRHLQDVYTLNLLDKGIFQVLARILNREMSHFQDPNKPRPH